MAVDETGRPTKYKEEYDDQAYKLCLLGLKDSELADYFEVKEQTINNWKKDHPSFFESLKRGKTIADAEVAAAFNKRAKGYEYTEVQEETRKGQVVSKKTTVKEVPPDAGAAMNWLSNRQPNTWRKSQQIVIDDHSEKTKDDLIDEIKAKLDKASKRD